MLRPFDYHRPTTAAEACALLASLPEAAVLAGGTDLLVQIRDGKHRVRHVVDIKGVVDLERVRRDGDVLVIGALATVSDLLAADHVTAEPGLCLLREAGAVFGCDEIRHQATICGNLAHASPGAEFGSPMFVLEAECVVRRPDGQRRIPIAELHRGPGQSSLARGQLLEAVRVPIPRPARSTYLRRSRVRGMDLAGLNLALLVLDPDDVVRRRVRIAVGAVAGTVIRMPEVEATLSGVAMTDGLLDWAGAMMSAAIAPRATSLRASPEYKKAMVAHLVRTALDCLLGPAPRGGGRGEGR